jgi:hypothetical protein
MSGGIEGLGAVGLEQGGGVDQQGDRAGGFAHEAAAGGGVGELGGGEAGLAPERLDAADGVGGVVARSQVMDDDVIAGLGGGQGQGRADPPAGAGDEGPAAGASRRGGTRRS